MIEEPSEPSLKVTMEFNELFRLIAYWKREAQSFKSQMEVNVRCADSCEEALKTIANMLGWDKTKQGPCPEDIEAIAVRLVREKLEQKTQS